MGRTVKDPNRRLPKPVQKVWLSEKNVGRRILLVVLLLAIGSGFLVYGFMNFLHGDSGWREISVKAGADLNCGEDFTLKYNVGASGVSAGGEAKALSLLYTDAAVKGYRLFNIDESFEDVTNLYDINQHPNEVLTVDPVLYDALKKVSDANCREIYLGPLYASLENLCASNDDAAAAQFDPNRNDAAAEETAAVAAFTQNPDDISLELSGENQVCLHVSDAYQAYAAEMGYTAYLDFFWMKNAFLIDYLADTIRGEGYQLGIISSKDGFVRCLDETALQDRQTNRHLRNSPHLFRSVSDNHLHITQAMQSDYKMFSWYRNNADTLPI